MWLFFDISHLVICNDSHDLSSIVHLLLFEVCITLVYTHAHPLRRGFVVVVVIVIVVVVVIAKLYMW